MARPRHGGYAELAGIGWNSGTGATGVKRCLHYEILEKSRSIVGGASVTVCGKKRKGTGKTGNFTGKSDIITELLKLLFLPFAL